MEAKQISKAVIKRLPRYYRYLGELLEDNVERISSNDLSKKMRVTASQIRQNKARDMAEILIENGIKAIWNFAHIDLDTPDDVIVENVHLSESLMTLSYNLSQYRQEHIDDEK